MKRVGAKPALSAALFGLLMIGGPAALAQSGNVDWPTYTGDISGSKYKPLDQINAANFSKLEVAWRFKTDNIGNRPEFKLEGTPLEVGEWSMPLPVRAAPWWRWTPQPASCSGCMAKGRCARRRRPAPALGARPSYWSDGKEERILYVTPGYQLICLNARPASASRPSATMARWTEGDGRPEDSA